MERHDSTSHLQFIHSLFQIIVDSSNGYNSSWFQCHFMFYNVLALCLTMYPLAGPHYLNLLNQLMAIRSSSGFSHLRPRAFHIALQTHKTEYTQLTWWKKRRRTNHGLGFAPSARREKFVTPLCRFLHICVLSRASIQAKFPHSHQEH